MNSSSSHPAAAMIVPKIGGGPTFDGVGVSTDIALGIELADDKNALLLSDIEARLTKEVRGLISSLAQFGSRAQLICEEIPVNAQFCKLVTSSLQLLALQIAISLGKGLDKPIFFDDGCQYLADLGLCLDDFIREVNLDGRRFLAIALIDEKRADFFDPADGAK